jgi:hypothetical protein
LDLHDSVKLVFPVGFQLNKYHLKNNLCSKALIRSFLNCYSSAIHFSCSPFPVIIPVYLRDACANAGCANWVGCANWWAVQTGPAVQNGLPAKQPARQEATMQKKMLPAATVQKTILQISTQIDSKDPLFKRKDSHAKEKTLCKTTPTHTRCQLCKRKDVVQKTKGPQLRTNGRCTKKIPAQKKIHVAEYTMRKEISQSSRQRCARKRQPTPDTSYAKENIKDSREQTLCKNKDP